MAARERWVEWWRVVRQGMALKLEGSTAPMRDRSGCFQQRRRDARQPKTVNTHERGAALRLCGTDSAGWARDRSIACKCVPFAGGARTVRALRGPPVLPLLCRAQYWPLPTSLESCLPRPHLPFPVAVSPVFASTPTRLARCLVSVWSGDGRVPRMAQR
eukprot:4478650-Pleurochrysis_carterae.AAC.5